MAFTLSSVVPWGRSLAEYAAMFSLSDADLAGRVLGCADGPASFQAEARERGAHVVSCDPLYRFSAAEIERRIGETYDTVMEQLRRNRDGFVWSRFASPEEVGEVRMRAMRRFLDDYPAGRAEGRYRDDALPALGFADGAFDLALCSHFLFLYSAQLDLDFHLAALRELARVAAEVRVYPLVSLDGTPSPHLDPVRRELARLGLRADRVPVAYEFQRGATEMLVVKG